MIGDRLRNLLHLGSVQQQSGRTAGSTPVEVAGAGGRAAAASRAGAAAQESIRHSHGLEQFFSAIRDRESATILDLSGASQANVNFITSLGHRLYSDDFLRSLDNVFGEESPGELQARPDRIEAFLSECLDYPTQHFDGALVWDMLQHLAPHLLERAVSRLHRILRPGSYVLCFFSADEKTTSVPAYTYRICDSRTLHLTLRGYRRPAQLFNNRALERLFQNFESVKFFLTRQHIREVIVRR